MKKSLILFVILLIVLFVAKNTFFNKNPKSSEGDVFKIGAAFAMTGDAAPWGEASFNAAKLAVDEINAKGGINGKKVKLVLEDTKSTSKDTVFAVSKLQDVDGVSAIAATWLDSFQGAGSVINNHMLLISQDAAIESVNVPTLYPRVFSTWYRTEAKSSVTLNEMKKEGITKIAVILQNDSYYSTLMSFIEKEAQKQGIKIISKEMINPNNGDLRTVLAKINGLDIDGLFFGSYDSKINAEFLKQSKLLLNKKVSIFGDEFIEQAFRSGDYPASLFEGIKYYVPASPSNVFIEKYKSAFKKEPVFSAGTTYDTIRIIAKYLADKPSDIDTYMRNTEFDTVTYGKIKFDNLGGVNSNVPAIVISKIEGGKIVNVK